MSETLRTLLHNLGQVADGVELGEYEALSEEDFEAYLNENCRA